ncbi:MAG: hypothetical protein HKN88_05080 [Gammaproteobacteria bacterium]|nr:hypothetical protein [Gammaproteobacteria bacterium]NNM13369.1 hypothetical protein [Gammaproteobacteria bacterium]
MHEKILATITSENLVNVINEEAINIHLEAHPQNEIIITIPFGVNEWYISVIDQYTGEELFSDWCEHYHSDLDGTDMLYDELQETVIEVIKLLNNSEIAIQQSNGVKVFAHQVLKSKQLLVETDAGYVDFWQAINRE